MRKLVRGEEAAYRDFRIYALTRFAASFSSTAAEARATFIDSRFHDKLMMVLKLD